MKKRKHTVPREYPDWLDDFGARIHDATLGEYPPSSELEWHATIYDFRAWNEHYFPPSQYGPCKVPRLFGVNISSEHWGIHIAKRTFEEAMNEINDFQIEHNIPSSNYKIHIQYRPERVKKDAMQMKLFTTFEMAGGDYEREA